MTPAVLDCMSGNSMLAIIDIIISEELLGKAIRKKNMI